MKIGIIVSSLIENKQTFNSLLYSTLCMFDPQHDTIATTIFQLSSEPNPINTVAYALNFNVHSFVRRGVATKSSYDHYTSISFTDGNPYIEMLQYSDILIFMLEADVSPQIRDNFSEYFYSKGYRKPIIYIMEM